MVGGRKRQQRGKSKEEVRRFFVNMSRRDAFSLQWRAGIDHCRRYLICRVASRYVTRDCDNLMVNLSSVLENASIVLFTDRKAR